LPLLPFLIFHLKFPCALPPISHPAVLITKQGALENLSRLYQLLQKTEWTEAEQQWLLQYFEQSDGVDLRNLLQQHFNDQLLQGKQVNPVISEKMLQHIHAQTNMNVTPAPAKRTRIVWIKWMAAAAVITGVLVTGAWFWRYKKPASAPVAVQPAQPAKQPDVLPGGDKAILTLADGSTIVLDDAQNGALAQQGATAVKKQGGQLLYGNAGTTDHSPLTLGSAEDNSPTYNAITIPRGGQYAIVLTDGTRVWLNAASSMRYPTAFTGAERRVEITGEAYFEVSPLPASPGGGGVKGRIPFIVSVNGKAEVEVLGTHFNINAYDDEGSIKTTLLEGKVRMRPDVGSRRSDGKAQTSDLAHQPSVILSPGQQAELTTNHKLQTTNNIDTDQVVAWKDGRFEFNGNTIQSVLRQLSRWYDVDIVYEGALPEANFVGAIARKEKLSQVLKMLELTNVIRFKIEEKPAGGKTARIIVMRK
jgi:transmembrane sensor